MLAVIKGAGDLATGVAHRFFMAGFDVIMTEIAQPTTVRRTVAFSEAVRLGEYEVEGVRASLASSPREALSVIKSGRVAVLVDPSASCVRELCPAVLVDAIIAKRNTGADIFQAPAVIALGPGFTAGVDCHCVIETMRGHSLGRALYSGSAVPNTGVPGDIAGHSSGRLLRAPSGGVFRPCKEIGDSVRAGDKVASVDGMPLTAGISGVLRGLLACGVPVIKGMKSGDIDPRGAYEYCFTISDKANAIAGGALEAALHLTEALKR